jgi:hypothetical protein
MSILFHPARPSGSAWRIQESKYGENTQLFFSDNSSENTATAQASAAAWVIADFRVTV